MEITKTNLKFIATENATLTGYKWTPKTEVNAVVVLCHGMAEHIDRYEGFANYLASNNIGVIGYNHRGHKGSIIIDDDYGYMSDIDNFKAMINDLDLVIDFTKKEFPDKEIFLFGHSMGSFITQRYIELHANKLKGAIVCGSGLNPKAILNLGACLAKMIMKSKGRRHRSKFIDNMAFGSYNNKFEKRTQYDWLNRKQDEVDKYIADPYCGGLFTVSFFYDFFNCMKDIQDNFDLIPKDFPILLVSGSMDPVGNYSKAVNALYEKLKHIGITDLKEILYQDARHEILLEIDHEETFNDVKSWLENRI